VVSLYAFKPVYQRLFRGLAGDWMTPNMATALGIFFAFVVAAGFLLGGLVRPAFFLIVPAGLILRMGANALDGMLAREKGLATPLGAVLNEMTDVVNDVICYAPLWFLPQVPRGVLLVFLLSICGAEFAGVLGQAVTGQRRYEGPLGGKSDRALWIGLGAFLCALRPSLLAHAGAYLAAVSVLVLLTMANRLRLVVTSTRKEA
jgi:CDP-diacylglycerol--glycerol-3-phosphate 3-phosphatidyltransferase